MRSLLLTLVLALMAAALPQFPEHWGAPPEIQTMDFRPLPGGYGHGSSTMYGWIAEKMKRDLENGKGVLPIARLRREPHPY
jgi:hypothetical protein